MAESSSPGTLINGGTSYLSSSSSKRLSAPKKQFLVQLVVDHALGSPVPPALTKMADIEGLSTESAHLRRSSPGPALIKRHLKKAGGPDFYNRARLVNKASPPLIPTAAALSSSYSPNGGGTLAGRFVTTHKKRQLAMQQEAHKSYYHTYHDVRNNGSQTSRLLPFLASSHLSRATKSCNGYSDRLRATSCFYATDSLEKFAPFENDENFYPIVTVPSLKLLGRSRSPSPYFEHCGSLYGNSISGTPKNESLLLHYDTNLYYKCAPTTLTKTTNPPPTLAVKESAEMRSNNHGDYTYHPNEHNGNDDNDEEDPAQRRNLRKAARKSEYVPMAGGGGDASDRKITNQSKMVLNETEATMDRLDVTSPEPSSLNPSGDECLSERGEEPQPTFETDGNILIMNDSPRALRSGASINEEDDYDDLEEYPKTPEAASSDPNSGSNGPGKVSAPRSPRTEDQQPSRERPVYPRGGGSGGQNDGRDDGRDLSTTIIGDTEDPALKQPIYSHPTPPTRRHNVNSSRSGRRSEDSVLEKVTYLLTLHPKYFDKFYQAHSFLLKGNGPLKYSDRNYLAFIAASRFQCRPLMDNQSREFLDNGGDPGWLVDVAHVPIKYRAIHELNKFLAHQPWLITKAHIHKLAKGYDAHDNWSMSELIFALALLSHFQSLCSLVHGCAWLYDLDDGSPSNQDEPAEDMENETDNVRESDDANEKTEVVESAEGVIEKITCSQLPGMDYVYNHVTEEIIPLGMDVTKHDIIDLAETDDVTVDTLIVKMKNLHQQYKMTQNSGQEELIQRYEKIIEFDLTVLQEAGDAKKLTSTQIEKYSQLEFAAGLIKKSKSTTQQIQQNCCEFHKDPATSIAVLTTCKECVTLLNKNTNLFVKSALPKKPIKKRVIKYLEDPEFCYTDFAKRDFPSQAPTFRIQDYSWEQHGYSLVSRLCSDLGPLLDDKFKTAYNLTYSTMGNVQNVDTSMFRRAIWNYIHCMYGIRYDDYDYRLVNQLLARNLKRIIKVLACYPERIFAASTPLPTGEQQKDEANQEVNIAESGIKRSAILTTNQKSLALIAHKEKSSTKSSINNGISTEVKLNDAIVKDDDSNNSNNANNTNVINKENFMRDFQESEKVHVNLMLMEAKIQAQMLYALRAIMQYMT